jgi:multidrug resistance efflux pump
LVRDGQQVKTGQPLVRLDVGVPGAAVAGAEAGVRAAQAQVRKAIDGKRARLVELDSQISQAEAGLRTALAKQKQAELAIRLDRSASSSDTVKAEAGVRQAEAGLRQAETAYRQAADTLKRTEFLFAHGGVARVDVEGARAQAEIAKAQRDSALSALDQARAAAKPAAETGPLRQQVSEADLEAARSGVQQARDSVKNAYRAKGEASRIADSDIEAARAQVEQAIAARRQAASQAGSGVLNAPFSGVVSELSIRGGETAQPGQPLMSITVPETVYVEAAVPSRYARNLKAGARAVVRLDTAPDRDIEGRVSEVLPVALDGRSIPVRVRLSGAATPLPGVGAKVDLMTK